MNPYSMLPIPTLSRLAFFITMIQCIGQLSADDSLPKITAETSLSEQQVKNALRLSEQQLNAGQVEVESLREKLGSGHPRFVRLRSAVSAMQEVHSIKQALLPLLVGPRDEKKQQEISQLLQALDVRTQELHSGIVKLDAENAKVLADKSKDEAVANLTTEQQRMVAMRHELERERQNIELERQKLAENQRRLEEAAQQMAKEEHSRALPPLENAELKIFTLKSIPASSAANAIEDLFGPKALRFSIENQSNSLIVLGKQESLQVIEALLTKLDQKEMHDGDKKSPQSAKEKTSRLLLVRLFWLADGLPLQGKVPAEVLPASVLRATEQLGLVNPILVTQTVNSLAVGTGDRIQFLIKVPALLDKQSVGISSRGELSLVNESQVAVMMEVEVSGRTMESSELQGSLKMPLGHYMVLGTANSVMPNPTTATETAAETGDPAAGAPRGEFGPDGGLLNPGAAPEGGMQGQLQPAPKFNTSRFAFVVQVIEAESFAPEEK